MKDEIFINADPGLGQVAPGTICAANEGRFDESYLDEPLTNYAVGGWDREPLYELLEFYAPACPVPRKFKYWTFDILDDFLRDEGDEDIRAIGADFAHVQIERKSSANGETKNKGLTISVDVDELKADPNVEERRTQRLMKRLLRNELRRALAIHNAAATNTNKTWGSSADPDMDVQDELRDVVDSYGVRPNRVAYGSSAWSLRHRAYRAQNNAGGYASAAMSPEQLAAFIMTENLAWGDAHFRDAAGDLTNYIALTVHMFQAASGMLPEDPSNIKRFVSEGGGLKVYRQQVSAKKIEISVEHYSDIVLTSAYGMRKFTVSGT